MDFCYKRVSTIDQNLDRQLPDFPCDREYVEKISGKDLNRPQLNALLQNIRAGDTVHAHELSRISRSMRDLLEIVEKILSVGASIKFHKENLEFKANTNDPFQKLMLHLLGSFSEFERSVLLERQREGIQIAKQKGLYKGKQSRFSSSQIQDIINKFNASSNKQELAKELGITRAYLYQLVKKHAEPLVPNL